MKKEARRRLTANIIKTLKIAVPIIILMLALIMVFTNDTTTKYYDNKLKAQQDAERTLDPSTGEKATVVTATLTETKTGTFPFDNDNEPGNDANETNDVVRTLDWVTWSINAAMEIKQGVEETEIKTGYIKVEATLPKNCANKVRWDTDFMAWAEESVLSEDKLEYTGYYSLGENAISIPGSQIIEMYAKVLYAENGFKFKPEIKVSIVGNQEGEAKQVENLRDITVSAKGNYDIRINLENQNIPIMQNDEEVRLNSFSFAFALKGDSPEKGLKGIESPAGDLKFDIDYSVLCGDMDRFETASLYNYKYNINTEDTLGNPNNTVKNLGVSSWRQIPWSKHDPSNSFNEEDRRVVYQNGKLLMEDNPETHTISVTISKWAISEIFPDRVNDLSYANDNDKSYEANEGIISVGMFYIVVKADETFLASGTQTKLTVTAKNMQIQTVGNSQVEEEVDESNNTIQCNLDAEPWPYYDKSIRFTGDGYELASSWGIGDSSEYRNKNINISISLDPMRQNIAKDWVRDYDFLLKFDDKAIEVRQDIDEEKYFMFLRADEPRQITCNFLYAARENGQGWESDQQMIDTTMEELKYYDTLAKLLNDNKVCVGIMIESKEGEVRSGESLAISMNFRTKADATIGYVAQAVTDIRLYNKKLDRETQTHLKTSNKEDFGKIAYSEEGVKYKKATFDEKGNLIQGNPDGSLRSGDSLRILGAKLNASMDTVPGDSSNKDIYNIGNGENEITYNVKVKLTQDNGEKVEGAKVAVSVTLPKGLTYKAGSSNKDEPTIQENEDGTTTLIWYEEDCSTNEEIEDLKFTVYIDERTENNKTYTATLDVYEVPGKDGKYKVGNDNRKNEITSSKQVRVVNMNAWVFTKKRGGPSVELDGELQYTLTFYNNSSDMLNDLLLLDILPYNGDNRETLFNGAYTLSKILIKGYDQIDKVGLYSTQEEGLEEKNLSVKDNSILKDIQWESIIPGDINKPSTAILLHGNVKGHAFIVIDIYLQTQGSQPLDAYVNYASAGLANTTDELKTSSEKITIIDREITGMVWFDENKNGIKDESEPYLPNISLSLVDEQNAEVNDVFEEKVKNVTTDENGKYTFSKLKSGKYKVKINISESCELTEKELTDRVRVNSKFNKETKETDVLDLEKSNDDIILEDNINAGLIKLGVIGTKTAVPEDGTVIDGEKITYKIIADNTMGKTELTALIKDILPSKGISTEKSTLRATQLPENTQVDNYEFSQLIGDNGLNVTVPSGKKIELSFDVEVEGEGLEEGYEIINVAEIDGIQTNEVKHIYKTINVTSSINKGGTSTIHSKDDEIDYTIQYNAQINHYNGNATVTITDTLPYALDKEKMKAIAESRRYKYSWR